MVLYFPFPRNDMQIRWAMKFLAGLMVTTRCSDIFLFDLFFCLSAEIELLCVWGATLCLCGRTHGNCSLFRIIARLKKCQIVWGMRKLMCARFSNNPAKWFRMTIDFEVFLFCMRFVKITHSIALYSQAINVEHQQQHNLTHTHIRSFAAYHIAQCNTYSQ